MFLWVDLRRYLRGPPVEGVDEPVLAIHHLSPQDKTEYQRREMAISRRCVANGVAIALGTHFFTEELGWFRLTFTATREALEIGLQRMCKTLQEIELEWMLSRV